MNKEKMLESARLKYQQYLKNTHNYEERLCYEFVEIEDRVLKLESFLGTNDFRNLTTEQVEFMKIQLYTMKIYKSLLDKRIQEVNIF